MRASPRATGGFTAAAVAAGSRGVRTASVVRDGDHQRAEPTGHDVLVVKAFDGVVRALDRFVLDERATLGQTVPVPYDVDVAQGAERRKHDSVVFLVGRLGRHANEEFFLLLIRLTIITTRHWLFGDVSGGGGAIQGIIHKHERLLLLLLYCKAS